MTRYRIVNLSSLPTTAFVLSIETQRSTIWIQKPVDVRRWLQLGNVQTLLPLFPNAIKLFEDEKDVPVSIRISTRIKRKTIRKIMPANPHRHHWSFVSFQLSLLQNRFESFETYCNSLLLMVNWHRSSHRQGHSIHHKDHCSWGDCPNGFIEDHFGTVII